MCWFRFKAKKSEPSPEYAAWLSQQKTFENIHHFIDDFTYVSDMEQYGKADYWETPSEFFATKRADCEGVHLFLADAFYRALGLESYLIVGWKWAGFLRTVAHGMTVVKKPDGKFSPSQLHYCTGGCLGAQYEYWKDPFIPIPDVCKMLRRFEAEVSDVINW